MVKIIMFKSKRKAVAMIELIFAIMIMGIAMLAIPNITAQSTKNAQSAINQEAVASASAQMQRILASYWDVADAPESPRKPVLNTTSKIPNTPTAYDKTEDIGSFNGMSLPIGLEGGHKATKQDYSDKKLNMKSTVAYTQYNSTGTYNFNPSVSAGGTTDIKRIAVALTSTENSQENKNVTLHAFSCNIGIPTLDEVQKP